MKNIFRNRKNSNAALVLGYVSVAIIAALFVLLTALHNRTGAGFFKGWENVTMLEEGWIADDGERQYNISLPCDDNLGITSETTTLTNTLPDPLDDEVVMMYRTSLQKIVIYIDDEKIYSYGDNEYIFSGKTGGSIWNIIPLEEEYAGKEIKLVITSPYKRYRNTFHEFYMGSYRELFSMLIRNHGINFEMSLVLMIMGAFMMGVFVFCTVFRIAKGKQSLWIGLFALSVGFWDFSECKLTQLLVDNITVNTQMDFILLSAMVIPILLYFDDVHEKRFHKIFVALTAIAEINTVVQIVLQIEGIFDFYEMMFVSHIIIGISAIFIVGSSLYLFVKERNRKYLPFIVDLIVLVAAGAYEVVVVYQTGFSNGSALGPAVLFTVIVCMWNTIDSVVEVLATGRKAVKESAAKTIFLANMSHEIRTPMNAICAMSEMLSESDTLSENDKDRVQTINTAALNLLDIINDILDYTKITAEKLEVTDIHYSLTRFLTDTYNPIKIIASRKNLDFSVAVSPNVPESLIGDGGKCRQILINLLNNAVKYTEKGSVKLTVDFKKIDEKTGSLIYSVADTGIGISRDNISKLFDVYSQVDLKRERAEESTGLGLAISRGLANLLGGDIEVVSNEGWGSVFTATVVQKYEGSTTYLDTVKEHGEEIIYSDSRIIFVPANIDIDGLNNEHERFDASAARVMVVDDNSTNLRILREMLGVFGIKPVLIPNGTQAIAAVKTKRFDLIYMDHMMPGIDGVETTAEIRKMKTDGGDKIKIIALTANAMKGAKEEFLKKGFDDYLSKPVSLNSIGNSLINNLTKDYIKRT